MKRRNVFKFLGVLALSPLVIIPKEKFPKVRKLKATWKLESAAELTSYHGMDAEKELTKMMSEELRYEIDIEALKRYNRSINKHYYFDLKIVGESKK